MAIFEILGILSSGHNHIYSVQLLNVAIFLVSVQQKGLRLLL